MKKIQKVLLIGVDLLAMKRRLESLDFNVIHVETRTGLINAMIHNPDIEVVIMAEHLICGWEESTPFLIKEIKQSLWQSAKIFASFPKESVVNERLLIHGCDEVIRPTCLPCRLLGMSLT